MRVDLPPPAVLPATAPTAPVARAPALVAAEGQLAMDRALIAAVSSALPPLEQRQQLVQDLLGALRGQQPWPASLQLRVLATADAPESAPQAPPAAALPADARLLSVGLQLPSTTAVPVPARLLLALTPLLLREHPELAATLTAAMEEEAAALPLPRLPPELAGQRIAFEVVDPRIQWALQALAMRGMLVIERDQLEERPEKRRRPATNTGWGGAAGASDSDSGKASTEADQQQPRAAGWWSRLLLALRRWLS